MSNDTTTTAGKIAVMQAFERGEACQWQYKEGDGDEWLKVEVPSWDWGVVRYRVKPKGPREFVIERRKSDGHFQKAHGGPVNDAWEIIKVREVIE